MPKKKIKFIEPMYARLVDKLPEGDEWLYEVKFDGYRCLAGNSLYNIVVSAGLHGLDRDFLLYRA